jgi:hypothetical protein
LTDRGMQRVQLLAARMKVQPTAALVPNFIRRCPLPGPARVDKKTVRPLALNVCSCRRIDTVFLRGGFINRL